MRAIHSILLGALVAAPLMASQLSSAKAGGQAPASAQATTAATAMIVLDGSGSMGGPLEGQTDVKFDMASRALLKLLPAAASQSRTGLVTFGNRRKGDCGDADAVIPAQAANLPQFAAVFSRIGPTGKGPLVQGVKVAAKSLPPDAPATLIVVHDDMDNCRQDVCAVAAEIAKVTPKVTVHVISISLDKTTSEKMSCLANATGGRIFEARDAASVEASLAEALRLARVLDSASDEAAQVAAAPSAAAVPEPSGPPSVRLTAGLSATSQPLTSPVQWRIMSAETAAQVVKEATVPVLTTELAGGTYVIEAAFGFAHARQTLDVAAQGQTHAQISLEAANLKVSSPAPQPGAVLTVTAIGDTAAAKPVYIAQDKGADIVVPAGLYRVTAHDGFAVKQQELKLAAGDVTPVEFALGTGRLELSSHNQDGGDALAGTTFIVSVDDPDAPQGRREVTRTVAPRPSFALAAGTYYVTAQQGAAEVRERIAIGTGDIVKKPIILGGAMTELRATFEAPFAGKEIPVTYRILSADKDAREVARIDGQGRGSGAEIFLPQGSYRIEALVGHLNVAGSAPVSVVSGPKILVNVGVAMSELTLLPSASASGWDVRDGQGRVLQRSAASRSQRTLLLAPGRYLVRVENGDDVVEKPIELKPGDRGSVPLSAN